MKPTIINTAGSTGNEIATAIQHLDDTVAATNDHRVNVAIEFILGALRAPRVLAALQAQFDEVV